MKELERKRLYKQANDLLDRATEILENIYADCSEKTGITEVLEKAA
ncbi:MAG: hypothetical protein AB9Q22_10060 [Candidatus Reddybacter sp.]